MARHLGEMPLRGDVDVAQARREVSRWAAELGFGTLACTKLATAASELARNTVVHGGGGLLRVRELAEDGRRGILLRFVDHGPGISNVEEALEDGFSTRRSMGLGLGGARRLVHELEIKSDLGEGTTVDAILWLR